MDLKIMPIDPRTAEAMLLRNDKNRSLSQRHVNRLAAEMTGEHWVLNGQSISFSEEGKLLDGQHRLNAVIKSGKTVPMVVVYGVKDYRAFQTYDQVMLKRGIHHVIEMQGRENAVKLTAISRRLTLWERTNDKTTYSLTSEAWRDQPDYEVIKYINDHADEIQRVFNDLKTSRPYKSCKAGSSLVAALIICNRVDEITTALFIDGLKTGFGITKGSPLGLLRDRLISPPSKSGLKWETEVVALTIKAWNKYRFGKSLKTLRWRQDSDAPERFPVPGGR